MRVAAPLLAWAAAAVCAAAGIASSTLPLTPFPPDVGSSNVLDVLNASPHHRIFVRLLQRSRLIPAINRLQHEGTNLTVLAPVDSAWPRPVQAAFAQDQSSSGPDDGDGDNEHAQLTALAPLVQPDDGPHALDNVNTALNALLRYHIIGRSLLEDIQDPPHSRGRQLESTLLMPRHTGPGGGGDGGEGSGEPLLDDKQKIFVNYYENITFGWSYGTAASSSNATKPVSRIAAGLSAVSCSKGVVISLDGTLEPPRSFYQVIKTHPQLKYISGLINLSVGDFPLPVPIDSRALTAYLPADEALLSDNSSALVTMTKDEAAWLQNAEDKLAAHDRAKFATWHVAAGEGVLYSPSQSKKQDVVMALGGTYTLHPHGKDDSDRPYLGPAPIIEESILLENGVVHLLGAPLSPYLSAPANCILPMNAHRILVARGASRFANSLHRYNLSWTIDQPAWPTLEDPDNSVNDGWPSSYTVPSKDEPSSPSSSQSVPDRLTILALTDDFLSGSRLDITPALAHEFGSSFHYNLATGEAHSATLSNKSVREQLSYHILPAAWSLHNLTQSNGNAITLKGKHSRRYLLPTELYPHGLGGRRQRLDVRVYLAPDLSPGEGDNDESDGSEQNSDDGVHEDVFLPRTYHPRTTRITFGTHEPLDLEPISVGSRGDVIWFLRGALEPPKDLFNALLSVGTGEALSPQEEEVMQSENGVAVFASWLSASEKTRALLERGQNFTGLIPRDVALSPARLGKLLANAITRSERNLDRLIQFAFVHDVVYTEDFPFTSTSAAPSAFQIAFSNGGDASPVFPTLEGSTVTLGAHKSTSSDGSVIRIATTPERGAGVVSYLGGKHDLLTDTGALHLVDSILFPKDLEITIADLLLSSGLTEMYELVYTTRFSHILGQSNAVPASMGARNNDTSGNDEDDEDRIHAPKPYVLLAPKSSAFDADLLAFLRNDTEAREGFVARHLIKLPGATPDCSPRFNSSYDVLPDLDEPQVKSEPGFFDGWRRWWNRSLWESGEPSKSTRSSPSWPPARPGPAPRANPLQSLMPVDLEDGLVWGTCAQNRLNQLALRVLPPPTDEEEDAIHYSLGPARGHGKASVVDKSKTYLIGINGAYGSATGKGHAAHILDRGIQIPRSANVSLSSSFSKGPPVGGGVLMVDTVLIYDPRWDAPPRYWLIWLFGLVAAAAALVPATNAVRRCWAQRRAGQFVEPLEGEEE